MRTVLALVFLAGCAQQPYWEQTDPNWVSKDVQIQAVDILPWPEVKGWAIRDQKTGICHVLIRTGVDRECVLAHEMKHCEGWDHPQYRYNLSC